MHCVSVQLELDLPGGRAARDTLSYAEDHHSRFIGTGQGLGSNLQARRGQQPGLCTAASVSGGPEHQSQLTRRNLLFSPAPLPVMVGRDLRSIPSRACRGVRGPRPAHHGIA